MGRTEMMCDKCDDTGWVDCECRWCSDEGHGGPCSCKAGQEIPEQPDGIEDDSRDMPEPMAAARRVIAFVAEFGDGLYDARNGKPLYGRDLEVLCRQVLG